MANIRASLTGRASLVWQTRGQRCDHFDCVAHLDFHAMSLKQRMPFLRWSVCAWRSGRARNIEKTGQIGDGRERPLRPNSSMANARTRRHRRRLATIDKFAYEKSMPDQCRRRKGELLDAAVRRANPNSPSSSAPTAATAHCASPAPRRTPRCTPSNSPRPTPQSPGASGRTPASTTASPASSAPSGDGGHTLDALANEHGFAAGKLDLLFIDHDKTPTCPTCRASWTAAGCTPAPSSSPTTSAFPARRSTAST